MHKDVSNPSDEPATVEDKVHATVENAYEIFVEGGTWPESLKPITTTLIKFAGADNEDIIKTGKEFTFKGPGA